MNAIIKIEIFKLTGTQLNKNLTSYFEKTWLFNIFCEIVIFGINFHVHTVSSAEDIPDDKTSLLDIENENYITQDFEYYVIYYSSKSDGIITGSVRNKREIATFLDKWFYYQL